MVRLDAEVPVTSESPICVGGAGADGLFGTQRYSADTLDGGPGDDIMWGDGDSPDTFIGGDDVDHAQTDYDLRI
ncbi:MAG: hypothetical protein ACRDOY_05450 [Nocardioidaceae bacterium]